MVKQRIRDRHAISIIVAIDGELDWQVKNNWIMLELFADCNLLKQMGAHREVSTPDELPVFDLAPLLQGIHVPPLCEV